MLERARIASIRARSRLIYLGQAAALRPLPTIVRVARNDVWEAKVQELMETTGRSRIDAQRAADFSFNDPNGFGVNELREKATGEKVDYSTKSGVQNRPVFSSVQRP